MQLHVARLCLDCEEVHDARTCPRCTSESFALLSRWIPAPERRATRRPPSGSKDTEAYRQILNGPETAPQSPTRWLKRGALLAAVGMGGWLWRQTAKPSDRDRNDRTR